MPKPSPRQPAQLKRVEQERKCVELRIAGHSQVDIGVQLGIREGRVREYIDSYLERNKPPGVEKLRATYMLRYEMMWRALVPRLENGDDDDAISSALKILEALRKLTGADAPAEVHAVVEHLMPDDIPLRRRILDLERANHETGAGSHTGNLQKTIQGTIDEDDDDEPEEPLAD